jgi:hypothetical protein
MRFAELDDIDPKSFAYLDVTNQELWRSFTPSFTSLTVVGATSYTGRLRVVGRQCQWQVQASAATSIASTAGTTYLALPIAAKGVAGMGVMTNDTSKQNVGNCHVDVTNSRAYLPAQAASGNVFTIAGWHEI